MEKIKIEVLSLRNKYNDQIFEIYRQNTCSNGGFFSDDNVLEVINEQAIEAGKRSLFVCAVKDDKVLGFIQLSEAWVPNSLYIAFLAVDKDYRREGIATALLEYVIHHSKGYKNLNIETSEANTIADKLYQSIGFKYILSYEVTNSTNNEKKVQNFYNIITKDIKHNKKLLLTQSAKEIKEENKRFVINKKIFEEKFEANNELDS